MSDRTSRRISLVGLAATGLTVCGILLAATVDMRWLVLTAVGTFGPGIARELGWLRDQDEFQRRASRRAGYHAYLAGGCVAVLTVAFLQAGRVEIAGPALAAALVLVVMWLTWLFSSLLDFYGAQRAASRTLLVFGTFWAAFVVLSHFRQPASLLIEGLTVLPFFILAWSVGRWPRLSGVLLVVVGLSLTVLLGFLRTSGLNAQRLLARGLTFVVFAVPLLASGLALVRARIHTDAEEAAAE